MTRTVLTILGMKDNRCREAVINALNSVEGVREADVSLFRTRATVLHDRSCDRTELIEAVTAAGYGAIPDDD